MNIAGIVGGCSILGVCGTIKGPESARGKVMRLGLEEPATELLEDMVPVFSMTDVAVLEAGDATPRGK